MRKNELYMTALKEIPRISKSLQDGDTNAREDMSFIISTLKGNREMRQGEAMAMASASSLINAVERKNVSADMERSIKQAALNEISCKFNCEADFRDKQKIELLKELL